MIRAAAKNHGDVVVVVEAADYAALLDEFARHGGMTTLDLRRRLAAKAFARTAQYDALVARYLLAIVEATRSDPELSLGVSPRGSLSLFRAAQAHAFMCDRDYVSPEDVKAIAVAARPELVRPARHHVQVPVKDDPEMRPSGTGVDQRARLAARLEPLDRETGPDEVEHHGERSVQLLRPVGGRRHGQQVAGRGQERLGIHRLILPGARRSAGPGGRAAAGERGRPPGVPFRKEILRTPRDGQPERRYKEKLNIILNWLFRVDGDVRERNHLINAVWNFAPRQM